MDRCSRTTVSTYCLLALAGGISCALPEHLGVQALKAMASAAPDVITLTGSIRDFQKSNDVFKTAPSAGNGHYAGNVANTLTAEQRPAYTGTGFKVNTQWRDQAVHPIPPHLFMSSTVARSIAVVSSPNINNNPVIDTFDSTVGAYGPTNQGPAPTWVTGSTMPTITQPTGMPANSNDVLYSGSGTTTISNDIFCKTFVAQSGRTIRISGIVRIVATELFKLQGSVTLEMLPDARLTVWTHKDVLIENDVNVNVNTHDSSRLMFYHTGTGEFTVENLATVYARVYSPNATFHVKNSASFMGTVTSMTATVDNNCGLHIDLADGTMCGIGVDDTAGIWGAASNGGLHSAARFADWYTDVLGTNLTAGHRIDLLRSSSGVYEYLDDSFHPIDGLLFGNEGESHNNYFTYTFEVPFIHHACAGRFFEFQGCDDAWLFVNGQLAIDLGGIMPGTQQYLAMDRLDLTDGVTYTLNFFYAQRQANVGIFRMRTNLDLQISAQTYTVSTVGD